MIRELHPSVSVATLLCLLACSGSTEYETLTLLGEPASSSAEAQQPDRMRMQPASGDAWTPVWHTAQVRVGGAFIGSFNTDIRLDSKRLGRGTDISFEDDLGFDGSAVVGRLDAFYRFNRRHRVDVSYFDIRRNTSRTLSKPIEWGGVTYPVNAQVAARFDTQILKASYGYTLFPEDNWELGLTVGLHAIRLGTGLSGSLSAGGSGVPFEASTEFKASAPLPVVGLQAEWVFARDFRLSASTQWFYLKIGVDGNDFGTPDEFEGLITDNTIVLEWDAFKFAGLGLGYNFFLIDASIGDDLLELAGEVIQGFMLYGRLFF